jgi:hypothetical protein
MKFTPILAALSGIFIGGAHAASSIQLEIGEMRDSSNQVILSGTWMLVLNTNNTTGLPGNINPNAVGADPITSSSADTTAAANDFVGLTLNLSSIINGDKIIAIGSIGSGDLGAGFADGPVLFGDGQEDIAYAIYWFPGLSVGDTVPSVFEVGGVFISSTDTFAPRGMISPPVNVAFESAVFDVTSFTAVPIPEPTTLMLSALAALGLLRRRRA